MTLTEPCPRGLPEPEILLDGGVWVTVIRRKPAELSVDAQVTGQVTGQVYSLLKIAHGESSRKELMEALELTGRENFEKLYLRPALDQKLVEMTIPGKPTSRLQKYRLTANGREILKTLKQEND
jgi:hypothetical protein